MTAKSQPKPIPTNVIEITVDDFITKEIIEKTIPIEGNLVNIVIPKDFQLTQSYSFQYGGKMHFFVIKLKEEKNYRIKIEEKIVKLGY